MILLQLRGMLAVVPTLILLASAGALAALHFTRPAFRYFWMSSVAGAVIAALATLLWPRAAPLVLQLPAWQPVELFPQLLAFGIDARSFPIAFALCMLGIAVLLTSGTSPGTGSTRAGYATLVVTGLGLLAVTAANPLTLVLIWTAFDLIILTARLGSVSKSAVDNRAVLMFASRVLASGIMVWAGVTGAEPGTNRAFGALSPAANVFLVLAAGLRMWTATKWAGLSAVGSVTPGLVVALGIADMTASLALLPRVSLGQTIGVAPVLLVVSAITAVAAAWTWMRSIGTPPAPSPLALACGSLAAFSALRGEPLPAAAWTTALIVIGGCVVLNTMRSPSLNRFMLTAAWSVSALPFSLTAATWTNISGMAMALLPFAALAQALLIAGYVVHTRDARGSEISESPAWIRRAYPFGLGALVLAGILPGLWGWEGAALPGTWPIAMAVAGVVALLVVFKGPVAKWSPLGRMITRLSTPRTELLAANLGPVLSWLNRSTVAITATLEGEGAVMWTLLFLVLLISLLAGTAP